MLSYQTLRLRKAVSNSPTRCLIMMLKLLLKLGNREPRRRRFHGNEAPPEFDADAVGGEFAPASSSFELETRYGLRHMVSQEWGMAMATVASCVCLFCAGAAAYFWIVFGIREIFGLFGLFLFISLICNRLAILNALKLFCSIQMAVTDSRNRRPSGWTHHIVGLFPVSVWCPPGELIAAAALMIFLRKSSDHLSERQHRIFDRAELAIAMAFPIQYLYPFICVAQFWLTISTPLISESFTGIAVCLLLTVVAMWTIFFSLRAMRRELADLVRATRWEVDPTSQFMSTLSLEEGLPLHVPQFGAGESPQNDAECSVTQVETTA
jgi:hypothetical protein